MAAPHASWLPRAAAALREADALLFHAGAGMGVDSGLPDFRGPQGFWRAYPPMKDLVRRAASRRAAKRTGHFSVLRAALRRCAAALGRHAQQSAC